MKPEDRGSFINRSFRRSFRRKKDDEVKKTPEEVEAEQQKALEELKTALDDVLYQEIFDPDVSRFLRTKNYDVKEAEKLARLHINCVRFLDLKNFSEETDLPEVYKKHRIGGFLGFDKEGNVVRLINYGLCDSIGYMNCVSTLDMIRCIFHFIRKDLKVLREESKKTGKNAEHVILIVNMENFNGNQIVYKPIVDTAMLALRLFQEHFYDICKNIFIINAPAIFSTFFKLLKPAMQENFMAKIKIFSNDKYKEVLLEHIDASILPVYFGGTRKDCKGDPRCEEFIGYGGEISQSFYRSNDKLNPNDPEVKSVVIEAGATIHIPVQVKEAGDKIKFSIYSKDNDMAFGAYYEPPEASPEMPNTSKKKSHHKGEKQNKWEPLTPIVRCQSQLIPITGYTITQRPGTHILQFDNSYSWMNPKEVLYKLSVEPMRS